MGDPSSNLGISLGYGLTPDEICRAARQADIRGFHSVWLPELQAVEVVSMLGSLTQVTRRARLGAGVLNVYSRSAALIAMVAATLDNLSGGRFILGLGSSTRMIVESWHSTPFTRPLERVEDYVKAVKTLLAGKASSYEGDEVKVKAFQLRVRPVQPHLPIFVGAVGDGMIRVAARQADGVLFFMRPLEAIRRATTLIQREAATPDVSKKLEIACSIVTCPSSDVTAAETQARRTIAYYVAVGSYYRRLLAAYGFSEAEDVAEAWRSGRREEAASKVSKRMLDALCVYGSAEDCRSSLEKFVEAGVSMPILQFNQVGGDFETSLEELLRIPWVGQGLNM